MIFFFFFFLNAQIVALQSLYRLGVLCFFRLSPSLLVLFIYLFMAVLGLRLCERALSSCGERGPLFIAVHRPLTVAASHCRAQAPDAQARQLWHTGLAAPRHVGSSQTRARTRVPCTGRQTLNHCATREALFFFLNLIFILYWRIVGLQCCVSFRCTAK